MKRPRPSIVAWGSVVGGILVYEYFAPSDELMSEGMDRMLERYPWFTRLAIALLSLHLANCLPERIDPFHHVAKKIRKTNR